MSPDEKPTILYYGTCHPIPGSSPTDPNREGKADLHHCDPNPEDVMVLACPWRDGAEHICWAPMLPLDNATAAETVIDKGNKKPDADPRHVRLSILEAKSEGGHSTTKRNGVEYEGTLVVSYVAATTCAKLDGKTERKDGCPLARGVLLVIAPSSVVINPANH